MMTIFRVSEASAAFDNMPTYEKRCERAQIVCEKLKEVFPSAVIQVSNKQNEGDLEVINMIENEMKVILNLLPE